ARELGLPRKRKVSPILIREVGSLLEQGLTFSKVAEKLKIKYTTVVYCARLLGVRRRRVKKIPPEEEERIVKLFQKYRDIAKVARVSGWHRPSIYRILRKRGLVTQSKFRKEYPYTYSLNGLTFVLTEKGKMLSFLYSEYNPAILPHLNEKLTKFFHRLLSIKCRDDTRRFLLQEVREFLQSYHYRYKEIREEIGREMKVQAIKQE
ncbi:hypothetical protein DRJ19_05050, partial [Candidatus Woesearchaeota archaeon]